jgi:uncharacterized coiled-coil DUF342 family protein
LPQLDHGQDPDIGSLGWNDLVVLKRRHSASIREVIKEIANIDTTILPKLNQQLREGKEELNQLIMKSRHNQTEVQHVNSDLLDLSEKIRQSKNFLLMMQNRMPQETEEKLLHVSKFHQTLVDGRNYGSNREKDQILSTIRDASMKLDAMKAFRTIRGQLQRFEDQCEVTRKSLLTLDVESRLLHTEISKRKRKTQELLISKHNVVAERGDRLSKCSQISKQLEKVNAQLDILSEARGSRGQVGFRAVYTSNIIKAKESAKKKLQSGGKLSFEELRLLYNEIGY